MPLRPGLRAPGPVPTPPVARRWRVRSAAPPSTDPAAIVAALLALRGVPESEAGRWLAPSLRDLPDPRAMTDMDAAVERTVRAIARGERVVVHGDYDVDGCTSTALLVRSLRAMGADVGWYAPHRLRDGYGIQPGTMRRLAAEGARVVITCDNGTSAHEAIAAGNAAGVDTIVVDHHRLPDVLPDAAAILNPRRDPPDNPFEDLAAVGVAFCFAVALRARLRADGAFVRARPEPDLREHLPVVALGTVADLAPLVGVNRLLVAVGLNGLAARKVPGLAALLEVARVAPEETLLASHLGYQLGPRVNAAGRLDEAARAVELLLCDELPPARLLADALDRVNEQRKTLEKAVFDDCLAALRHTPAPERGAVVLWSADWHPGVVGIVAARVSRHVHRPAILLAVRDGQATGSGRAIPGVDLFAALRHVAPLLVRCGGHRAAGGLTVDEAQLPALRAALADGAFPEAPPDAWTPETTADLPLDLAAVDEALFAALARLGPFGLGNPEPCFLVQGVRFTQVQVLSGGVGVRGRLQAGRGPGRVAVGFGLTPPASERVDALVCLQENHFRGRVSLELRLRDLRPAAG